MKADASKIRELGQLRVDALRTACIKRGLPSNGRKDQLIARLAVASPVKKRTSPTRKRASPARAQESPVRKRSQSAFQSPQRTTCNDQNSQTPSRNAAPRRRLREKSPDPHRCVRFASCDQSPASPLRQHAILSPIRVPRRRIREKSPDPHRHTCLADSPRRLISSPWRQPKSPDLSRRNGSPNMFESHAMSSSSFARIPGTPSKRLRQKTGLRSLEELISQDSSSASQGPTDPSAALLLLTRRELIDICIDCDVDSNGAKAILVQRLVEAHKGQSGLPEEPAREGVRENYEVESVDNTKKSELDEMEHFAASPQGAVPEFSFPPKRRLSGGVPLPPSSWTLAQLCDEPEPSRSTASPERHSVIESLASPDYLSKPSRFSSPETGQESVHSPPPKVVKSSPVQQPPAPVVTSPVQEAPAAMAHSPTLATTSRSSPEEHDKSPDANEASASEASSSHCFWRDVATRWPTIIAKLRTGSNVTDTAPSFLADNERKRHQSALDDLQSPKRHCVATIYQSVPTPTRQMAEFLD